MSTVIDSIDLAVTLTVRGAGRGTPDGSIGGVTAPLAPYYAFTVKRDPHDVQPHASSMLRRIRTMHNLMLLLVLHPRISNSIESYLTSGNTGC